MGDETRPKPGAEARSSPLVSPGRVVPARVSNAEVQGLCASTQPLPLENMNAGFASL